MNDLLKSKLKNLSTKPGCYLMKDSDDKIIYVGKAKNLYKRVNQYFKGSHDFKTSKMVSLIEDFDFIITNNEKEALILEYNLIKLHNPRFNIIFKDDKSYPYIFISDEKYFRLRVVRASKHKKLKGKLFGPYPSAKSARAVVNLLDKLFQTRKCVILPKKECMYYHLNLCLGYCIKDIEKQVLNELRNKIIKFLKGDIAEQISILEAKRDKAIAELNYEAAKIHHELILDINHLMISQNVELNSNTNIDVLSYYLKDHNLVLCLLNIRVGKLLNKQIHSYELNGDLNDAIANFIYSYYQKHPFPGELVVDKEFITDLQDQDEYKITAFTKGVKYNFLMQAKQNAEEYFKHFEKIIIKSHNYYEQLKLDFKTIFNKNITDIEMIDNSHFGSKNSVSALVYFKDFKPLTKNYRLFKVHDGANDLALMYEALDRYYHRKYHSGDKLADILIVDGGYNQLKIAKEIKNKYNLDIILLALVKNEKHHTSKLLNENFEEIKIAHNSKIFFFLTSIQDEVHRFVLNYQKKLRTKQLINDELLKIEGIGEKRLMLLWEHFKSLNAIKNANEEKLAEVLGYKLAKKVYNYYRNHVRDN